MQAPHAPEQSSSVEIGYIIQLYHDNPEKHKEYIKNDKTIMEILRLLYYNGVTTTGPVLESIEMFKSLPLTPFLEAVARGEIFIPVFHMEMNMFYRQLADINKNILQSEQEQQELFNFRTAIHGYLMRTPLIAMSPEERSDKIKEINDYDKRIKEVCIQTANLKEYKLRFQHIVPLDVNVYYSKLSSLFDQLHALQERRVQLRMECAMNSQHVFNQRHTAATVVADPPPQAEPPGPQAPPPPSADGPGPL